MVKEKINTVLFDMDGLMFDTERIYVDTWKKIGELYHISIGDEFLLPSRGMIRADSQRLFESLYDLKSPYDELIEIRQTMIKDRLKQGFECKQGLYELLKYLQDNQYHIVLATSTPKERAMWMLEQVGVKDYFHNYVFGDMVKKGKPEPDIFIKAAESVAKRPEQCLVLEDSFNGVRAGKRAGCHVIMIPDLVQPTKEIEDIYDDKLEHLGQVISWLELHNK